MKKGTEFLVVITNVMSCLLLGGCIIVQRKRNQKALAWKFPQYIFPTLKVSIVDTLMYEHEYVCICMHISQISSWKI